MNDEAAPLGLVDDRLRRLHAYWLERRGSRSMPARADIDPLDFTYILGWVMLVDVERPVQGGLRFRYRLYGANVAEHSRVDLTGRYTEDFPGAEFAAALRESYTRLVEGGVPRRSQRREYYDDRYYELEALLLPLGEAETVTMILIGLAFGPWIPDDNLLK